jgi:transcriptional regulator with GAF, ATPase, and Fis domain
MSRASKMEKVVTPFASKPAPAVFEVDWTGETNFQEFMDTIEYELVDRALEAAHGVVHEAARLLGLERTTFSMKMKKHGIVASHHWEAKRSA